MVFCRDLKLNGAKNYHKLVHTIKSVLNMKANSNETEHKVVSNITEPIKGHTENVTSSWRSNGKDILTYECGHLVSGSVRLNCTSILHFREIECCVKFLKLVLCLVKAG